MFGIIYKAINILNNNLYIGQTSNSLRERKYSHKWCSLNNKTNYAFHNAINFYGMENFLWEEIDYANTKEELNKKEIYWISFYKANRNRYKEENNYNLTDGGQSSGCKGELNGRFGYHLTEEEKLNLRLKNLGKKQSEDSIEKRASKTRGNLGYQWNDINIDKILEFYFNGYSSNQISKMLNITNNVTNSRLQNLNLYTGLNKKQRILNLETRYKEFSFSYPEEGINRIKNFKKYSKNSFFKELDIRKLLLIFLENKNMTKTAKELNLSCPTVEKRLQMCGIKIQNLKKKGLDKIYFLDKIDMYIENYNKVINI